jgi:hypothetical protein
MPSLPELEFDRFYTYAEVTGFVDALHRARPDLCRLGSLGPSRQGREVPLLTVTDHTTGSAEDRPAYLIHGNIHAGELAGTHAALYTARQLLVDHPGSDLLRRAAFYVVPRINPDGAEYVVTQAGRVRSRVDRTDRLPNTLYQEDLDGDGMLLTMRQQHPDGDHVADAQDPRLLVRREADSSGPFYRLFPEGLIHDWDGSERILIEGRTLDWNRNWAYNWRPEPTQAGAGDYPFSELEMRHLAEFIHGHPNIFGVLGYHTGPAAVLRPPSSGSLDDLEAEDDQVMEDLARIAARETGFPVIPVVKYHTARSRDINLHGHFHDFGYHHLGLFVFEFELGTALNSAGISTEKALGTRTDREHEALLREAIKWWGDQAFPWPLVLPWKPFDHPQLGRVEMGGFVYPYWANPALSDLPRIARGTYRFTVEHAGRHPRLVLEDLSVDPIEGSVYRVRVRVANRGGFPTHVTEKGKGLRRLRPVRVEFHPASGVELLSAQGHATLGHLQATTDSRQLEWFVSSAAGRGDLCTIRVLGGAGGNVSAGVVLPN